MVLSWWFCRCPTVSLSQLCWPGQDTSEKTAIGNCSWFIVVSDGLSHCGFIWVSWFNRVLVVVLLTLSSKLRTATGAENWPVENALRWVMVLFVSWLSVSWFYLTLMVLTLSPGGFNPKINPDDSALRFNMCHLRFYLSYWLNWETFLTQAPNTLFTAAGWCKEKVEVRGRGE